MTELENRALRDDEIAIARDIMAHPLRYVRELASLREENAELQRQYEAHVKLADSLREENERHLETIRQLGANASAIAKYAEGTKHERDEAVALLRDVYNAFTDEFTQDCLALSDGQKAVIAKLEKHRP